MQVQATLVINSKGGSGKTTVSTNLASYYANQGYKTALMDYDPQGSSLQWLKVRPESKNPIHGANAAKAKTGALRSWQMHVPRDIEKIIIDAPAGSDGILLQEMCRRSNQIVIPVSPSAIDVHASTHFIKDLMLIGKVRQANTRLAVIANRNRSNRPLYEPLERFLNALNIPFVTKLTDSDVFINAAEQGLGLYDLNPDDVQHILAEFNPLVEWIENKPKPQSTIEEKKPSSWKPSNLVDFPRMA